MTDRRRRVVSVPIYAARTDSEYHCYDDWNSPSRRESPSTAGPRGTFARRSHDCRTGRRQGLGSISVLGTHILVLLYTRTHLRTVVGYSRGTVSWHHGPNCQSPRRSRAPGAYTRHPSDCPSPRGADCLRPPMPAGAHACFGKTCTTLSSSTNSG